MDPVVYGLSVILVAGAIGSATLLPMKFVKNWQWENTWLLYASLAYLACPLVVAWWTIPNLLQVYSEAGSSVVGPVALFGFGWGVSVVMLGLAVDAVGLAVSTGIIMGCSIALGSLIPLLWADRSQLATSEGVHIVLADAVILGGVFLCAYAAYLRETQQANEQATGGGVRGIVICFVAGMLTPLLNLALAKGAEITRLAAQFGAAEHLAANGVWGLAVSAGSAPSIVYCLGLLSRKRSWSHYNQPGRLINGLFCLVMAIFFISSTVGYGMGALSMGNLGPAIGWPVYISSLIIGNNFWGWLTGEWRDAPKASFLTMLGGIIVQVLGIALLFVRDVSGT